MKVVFSALTILISIVNSFMTFGQNSTVDSFIRPALSSDSLIRIERSQLDSSRVILIDKNHFEALDSTVQVYKNGQLIIGKTQAIINYLTEEEAALKDWVIIVLIGSIIVISAILLIWIFWWRYRKIKHSKTLLLSQINVLKNQMNPHFLYNSLNFISEYIVNNPKLAEKSIKELAEVYEFVVQNFNEELVSLDEEVAMATRYAQILKYRFGDSFSINMDLQWSQDWALPPLTLQLLIENALKHNRCSPTSPLRIDITIKEGWLCVANDLNPVQFTRPSASTGMDILKKRFEIHSKHLPEIHQTESDFIVLIPLTKVKTI